MSFSGDLKGFCDGSRVIAFKPNCYPVSSNIFSSGRIGNCIVVCTDHLIIAVCNLYRWLFYFSIISIACSGKLYFFRIIDDLFILYTSAAALLLCISVGSGGCLYCYSLIVMCMCDRSCLDSEIHRIRKCICILCMIHRCHRYPVIPRRQCAGPACSIHSILKLRRIGFSCFIHIYIIISGIACCIPGKRCGLIRFSRIHAHIWLARYTNTRIDKAKQHLVGIIRAPSSDCIGQCISICNSMRGCLIFVRSSSLIYRKSVVSKISCYISNMSVIISAPYSNRTGNRLISYCIALIDSILPPAYRISPCRQCDPLHTHCHAKRVQGISYKPSRSTSCVVG